MVSYETIDFEMRGAVAWLTMNRPKAFNALDLTMAKELCDLSIRLGEDDAVRCVVLTGAGDAAFCAGGDVPGFAADVDNLPTMLKEMTTYLHMAISRFAWMRAPVISAVNGVAAGAGLSLVACTDLAIAVEGASFTSAYTKIGLTPDGSSTYFLPRIIGTRRTAELYMTNRVLNAEEALDWGLINKIVPGDQLVAETEKLANKLASGPTVALGSVKKLLLMTTNDSLESQMERETRSISAMGKTTDGRNGVVAFVNKQKPDFIGE
ncbi:MAG: enoyl-CoA hydratase-related protein [Alphaproteobacteria bacterium]|jgi:2-(1,2-epoxy-1,2-dihydrophenyl)acetyl-CoA isomerase|nr:enoyl-CoA hydratase-related protein [Alphaproteobacteria bacterium]